MSISKGKLIRGRFTGSMSSVMEEINQSILFDNRLFREDVEGSIAHSKMLADRNIITTEEYEKIKGGLLVILKEIEDGKFEFNIALEDIHINIESRLRELIGPVSGKLPTARSRNDQVATDFKIWIRKSLSIVRSKLFNLTAALLNRAEQNIDVILPGFTHLQIGQPVSFGQHMLAYVEMFERDIRSVDHCINDSSLCPLGAAALAGTGFDIDRHLTANLLGFEGPTRNSIDSVSDRDFLLDFISVANKIGIHLSRLAEEIVLWISPGFKFIMLSDNWTTGSSIMPQKRNPDAAEIIRGKVGRIIASYNRVLLILKSLPLTFSKDMQEDKEAGFEAFDTVTICLDAMIGMVKDFTVQPGTMKEMAKKGFSTATDVADWLVKNKNMPFREAHDIVANLVQLCERENKQFTDLSQDELCEINSNLDADIFNVMSVENSVASKSSFGGTAPQRVREQIKFWQNIHARRKY